MTERAAVRHRDFTPRRSDRLQNIPGGLWATESFPRAIFTGTVVVTSALHHGQG